MNKHIFLNQKLYVYTDKQMRLLIPKIFSYKFGKDPKVYSLYYIGDDTIRAFIEKESSYTKDSTRLTIPRSIQKIMNIQVNDLFEVEPCENGFLLKRVNKEDIE